MPITRAFKSGNSQAVRIPAEIAYERVGEDLSITRMGDVITIKPTRRSFRDALERLRSLPRSGEIEPREPIEVPERHMD